MANPFDGTWIEPKYEPKRVVDPNSGIIWELDPELSGRGWRMAGVDVPPESRPPRPSSFVPQHLQDHLRFAPPTDEGAIAIASAISQQRQNENYNSHLAERYADAFLAWKTGKGVEPPSIAGKWRIANFMELFAYTSTGTPVPYPPEVNFNTRG